MKKNSYLLVLVIVSLTIIINGCKEDPVVIPDSNSIKLSDNETFGKVITDSEGKTLYFFSKDTKEVSMCVDGCLDNWPVFYAEDITVDAGLDVNDFKNVTREDGSKQTTYKSWSLYYFVNDNYVGDVNGDKVIESWYVAKPDYSLMYANAQLVGHDGMNYTSEYEKGDGTTFYLVDIDGKTLYTFSKDSNNTNNFTASDLSNNGVWPVAEIDVEKIPSILNIDDFGTIDVYGKIQLTYKGWPLYYYGQDAARGDNKGISFPAPGVWPVANTQTVTAP